MDPNEACRGMSNLTKHWGNGLLTAEEYAEEMAKLWEALDGWLSKEGFLPDKWTRSFESRRLDGPPCEKCGTFHPSCE